MPATNPATKTCLRASIAAPWAPLLHNPARRAAFLGLVAVLLLGSCSLFYFGLVKVKMLPFDNKKRIPSHH